jgi:hypothetical protein
LQRRRETLRPPLRRAPVQLGPDIFERGLHAYIDELQAKLNTIGAALFQAYITQTFSQQADEEIRQQEEQQQQQRGAPHLPRP